MAEAETTCSPLPCLLVLQILDENGVTKREGQSEFNKAMTRCSVVGHTSSTWPFSGLESCTGRFKVTEDNISIPDETGQLAVRLASFDRQVMLASAAAEGKSFATSM